MPGWWYGVQTAACAEGRLLYARREQIGARRGLGVMVDYLYLLGESASASATASRGAVELELVSAQQA